MTTPLHSPPQPVQRMSRTGYLLLGSVLLALGIAGTVLSMESGSLCMILAAVCLGKSSRRCERWLLQHPRLGPALILWREERAISRRTKLAGCGALAFGLAAVWYFSPPSFVPRMVVTIGAVGCALYLLCRPVPRSSPPNRLLAFGDRHARSLAASFTALAHIAFFAALLWTRTPDTIEMPSPVADRTQLLLLPPRAPEVTPEEVLAPTPSSAAVVKQKPEPPRPLPPTPPRVTAHWTIPPPTPPQPAVVSPAPQQQQDSVAAAPPSKERPPAPSETAPGRDSWEGRVMARLERFRRYPNAARAKRQEGVVQVRVSLARDGSLLALSLETTSGFPVLDQAALDTFRRAAPLPKVPDDRQAPVELSFPVEFFMR